MITTEVKERPILFSGPMVKALLDGTKTQTRRTIKPQPDPIFQSVHMPALEVVSSEPLVRIDRPDACRFWLYAGDGTQSSDLYPCPYGQPGERLWVRETVGFPSCDAGICCIRYAADGARYHVLADNCGEGDLVGVGEACPHTFSHARVINKPSIFMRRWACRLVLEVTAIRVERLQQITEEDAQLEGFEDDADADPCPMTARDQFSVLWEKINGKGAWSLNPWVWVVSFKKV